MSLKIMKRKKILLAMLLSSGACSSATIHGASYADLFFDDGSNHSYIAGDQITSSTPITDAFKISGAGTIGVLEGVDILTNQNAASGASAWNGATLSINNGHIETQQRNSSGVTIDGVGTIGAISNTQIATRGNNELVSGEENFTVAVLANNGGAATLNNVVINTYGTWVDPAAFNNHGVYAGRGGSKVISEGTLDITTRGFFARGIFAHEGGISN